MADSMEAYRGQFETGALSEVAPAAEGSGEKHSGCHACQLPMVGLRKVGHPSTVWVLLVNIWHFVAFVQLAAVGCEPFVAYFVPSGDQQ